MKLTCIAYASNDQYSLVVDDMQDMITVRFSWPELANAIGVEAVEVLVYESAAPAGEVVDGVYRDKGRGSVCFPLPLAGEG